MLGPHPEHMTWAGRQGRSGQFLGQCCKVSEQARTNLGQLGGAKTMSTHPLAWLQSQAMLYWPDCSLKLCYNWFGGSPVLLHSGVSPSTSKTSLQADDEVVYMKAWPSWQGRPMQAHRGMQANAGKDKLREGA